MNQTKERNYILTTIVSTLVIIGLFVFCYYWFIEPMYLNNLDQQKSVSIKKESKIAFGKYKNQQKVFGIELEVTGYAASNVDISISDGKKVHHTAAVKGKKMDFVYKNDWHSDSCFITIVPRGKIGGKASVNCRFLAID